MKTKIYVLCAPDGEIRYIGKTSLSFARRFYAHLYDARHGMKDYRCNWIRSVLSTGFLPTISFIGEVEGDGSEEEIAWIAYGRAEGWRLVNGTDGGEGSLGNKMSEKLKQRWFSYHKGRPLSAEQKKKIGSSLIGRKHSENSRHLMSISQRGKVISSESRRKMSLAKKGKPSPLKGVPRSAAVIMKTRLALRGRHLSPEHRANISASLIGRTCTDTTHLKLSKCKKEYWENRRKLGLMSTGKPSKLKGRHLDAEHCAKLSLASKGIKKTPEHCQNIRNGLKRHHSNKRKE